MFVYVCVFFLHLYAFSLTISRHRSERLSHSASAWWCATLGEGCAFRAQYAAGERLPRKDTGRGTRNVPSANQAASIGPREQKTKKSNLSIRGDPRYVDFLDANVHFSSFPSLSLSSINVRVVTAAPFMVLNLTHINRNTHKHTPTHTHNWQESDSMPIDLYFQFSFAVCGVNGKWWYKLL